MARRPHTPRELGIRRLCEAVGIVFPTEGLGETGGSTVIKIASATVPPVIKAKFINILWDLHALHNGYTGVEEAEDHDEEGDTFEESMESEEEFCDDEEVEPPAEEKKDSPRSYIYIIFLQVIYIWADTSCLHTVGSIWTFDFQFNHL